MEKYEDILEKKMIDNKQVYQVNFEKLKNIILKDLNKNTNYKKDLLRKYKKEDLRKFLENPSKFEKQFMEISNYFYNLSNQYKRLINLFAKMFKFYYTIQPYEINYKKIKKETIKNAYDKNVNLLEKMNIKHEFTKLLTTAFREDVFYGYIHETSNSFYIQKLNPQFCAITSIEDGCFLFSFDFSYFDSNKDKLPQYPDEFSIKYNMYLKDKKNKWIELDGDNTICIKINEELDYVIPPFIGVFESIIDIDDFKALNKTKEQIGIYKLLTMKIPINTDGTSKNDLLIDEAVASQFYGMADSILPEEVGLILSPMDIKEVDFKQDNSNSDMIERATRDFWDDSGVNQLLFNSKNTTGASLSRSINSDESILFAVINQIERWINKKLKKFNSNSIKFKISFLESTIFNEKEITEKYLTASQNGMPTKIKYCASLGISPSDLENGLYLENDILDLTNKFEPLKTSYNISGDNLNDKAGRDKVDDDKVDGSTDRTRENDANNPENRR